MTAPSILELVLTSPLYIGQTGTVRVTPSAVAPATVAGEALTLAAPVKAWDFVSISEWWGSFFGSPQVTLSNDTTAGGDLPHSLKGVTSAGTANATAGANITGLTVGQQYRCTGKAKVSSALTNETHMGVWQTGQFFTQSLLQRDVWEPFSITFVASATTMIVNLVTTAAVPAGAAFWLNNVRVYSDASDTTLTPESGNPGSYLATFTAAATQELVGFVVDSTGLGASSSLVVNCGTAPPPPAATKYGVSHGATILTGVHPNIVRTYNSGQRGDATAGGYAQQLSYKPASDAERTAIRNNTPANKTAVKAYINGIADVARLVPDEFTYDHERDNAATFGSPQEATYASNYQAESVVVKGWLDEVNAGRTNKILWTPTTTGDLLRKTGGTLGLWYVPSSDKIGVDVYNSPRIPDAAAFAALKGKPWSMPEWGADVNTDQNDAQCLAVMNADSATIAGFTSGAPSPVMWFNANHNQIATGHPNSLAKLTALCAL